MKRQLLALLRGSAPLVALVPAGSINWRRHPQGRAWPGIVLTLINDMDSYTVADRVNHQRTSVQIDCWGRSDEEAEAMAHAVRGILSDYRDEEFTRVHMTGRRDSQAMAGMAPDNPPGVSLDYDIDFQPA